MLAGGVDVDAAFDRCGSAPQELRSGVLECRRSALRALDEQLHRALRGRGHDPVQLCAPELRANLAHVAAYELLQIISLGRRDALLEVFRGEASCRLWCSNGEVVDAVCGRLKGEAAAYRFLALAEGEVVVDFRAVQRPRQITRSTQALVMEALRRKDECARLEARLGGRERVYRSVAGLPATTELSPLERALLLAFSRGARVAAVQDCSAVDDVSLLETLVRLVDRGWIVGANDGSTLGSIPPVEPPAVQARKPWLPAQRRRWLWVASALALGAGSSALTSRWLPREPKAEVSSASRALTGMPEAELAGERAASASGAASGAPLPEAALPTYGLRLVADPPNALIWLDGAQIGTGEVSLALPRDGRTHELRITAPCHSPETLLFRDIAPPRAVLLAPLPRARNGVCKMSDA